MYEIAISLICFFGVKEMHGLTARSVAIIFSGPGRLLTSCDTCEMVLSIEQRQGKEWLSLSKRFFTYHISMHQSGKPGNWETTMLGCNIQMLLTLWRHMRNAWSRYQWRLAARKIAIDNNYRIVLTVPLRFYGWPLRFQESSIFDLPGILWRFNSTDPPAYIYLIEKAGDGRGPLSTTVDLDFLVWLVLACCVKSKIRNRSLFESRHFPTFPGGASDQARWNG